MKTELPYIGKNRKVKETTKTRVKLNKWLILTLVSNPNLSRQEQYIQLS